MANWGRTSFLLYWYWIWLYHYPEKWGKFKFKGGITEKIVIQLREDTDFAHWHLNFPGNCKSIRKAVQEIIELQFLKFIVGSKFMGKCHEKSLKLWQLSFFTLYELNLNIKIFDIFSILIIHFLLGIRDLNTKSINYTSLFGNWNTVLWRK